MSTALLDRNSTVHEESPNGPAAAFRAPDELVSSSVAAAIERIVAAAPRLNSAQRDRLATILGGGSR